MRALFIMAILMLLFSPCAQAGQESEDAFEETATPAKEAPAGGKHVVTSVAGCLDQLPDDQAAEIRRNSIKPYQDCQKRLSEFKKEKKAEKKRREEAGEEPETPANFVRVTEPDDAAEEAGEESEEEDDKPKRSKQRKKAP